MPKSFCSPVSGLMAGISIPPTSVPDSGAGCRPNELTSGTVVFGPPRATPPYPRLTEYGATP